jgi:sortase A
MQTPDRLHGKARWSRFLFAAGTCLVLASAATYGYGEVSTRAAKRDFARQLSAAAVEQRPGFPTAVADAAGGGRAAWRARAAPREGDLIGLLTLPRLDLVVPVREGTSEATLLQGAGHVFGTARPGQDGNVALAAHRDMHFRPLRKVRAGDEVRLTTLEGTRVYRVERTAVVEPDDVSALAKTDEGRLTLITCYPFSFVGRAPRRFLVFAEEIHAASGSL